MTKVGPIPTITAEQSQAINEILPFIPLSMIESDEAESSNPLIPLLKGEIIMQNELIRVSTPDYRRKSS